MNSTLTIMALNLFGKLFSFVKEMIFSYRYGTGAVKDAFNTSTIIITTIFSVFTLALTKTFIPVYGKIEREKGNVFSFTSNLFNISLVLSFILSLIAYFAAPFLVKIFAAGFTGERLEQSVFFTRVLLFTVFIHVYAAVFTPYLQIKGKFAVTVLPAALLQVFISIFVVLSAKINFLFLPLGMFVSFSLQFLFIPFAVSKTGFKYEKKFDLKDKNIKKILTLSAPVIFAQASIYISTIADQSFASYIMPDGGVSVTDYALKIHRIVMGIFIIPVQTTLYPLLSKLVSENDYSSMKKKMSEGINSIFLMVIPAVVGLMFLSKELIRIIYERGAFTHESTLITSKLLFRYAPYLIGAAVGEILYLAFFADSDTKTPTAVTFVQTAVNVFFNRLLQKYYGLAGLAAATVINSFTGAFLIAFFFIKRYGKFRDKVFLKDLFKIISAAGIMLLRGMFLKEKIGTQSYLSILLNIFSCMIVYGISILILKTETVKTILKKYLK